MVTTEEELAAVRLENDALFTEREELMAQVADLRRQIEIRDLKEQNVRLADSVSALQAQLPGLEADAGPTPA